MDPAYRSFNNWKHCRNGSAFIKSRDMSEISRVKNITQTNPLPNHNSLSSRPKTPNNPLPSKHLPQDQKITLYFQLISITTIDLSSDKHLPSKVVGIIKEMQGEYNRESRSWVIPYRNYPKLFTTLQQLRDECLTLMPITLLPIDFMCLPDKLSTIEFNSALKPKNRKERFRIDYTTDPVHYFHELPSNLREKLYKFQQTGVEFGIRKSGRLLLADEMGVGKTVQAICISAIYKEEWPVLVLCPSSLKLAWRDEINTWLIGDVIKEKEVQVFKSSKDNFKDKIKFYIVSYDLSVRIIDKIIEKNFNFIISDESHYLKNKESKRSQFLIPIMQRCKRLILISGTPILAKPIELYPLLTALRPDVFKSFKEFGPRYCNPQKTYFGMDWSGSSNVKELHLMLSKLMIRRLKKEVLAELPPKKRQKIEIQSDKKVLTQIRVLLNKIKLNLDDEKILKDLNILDEQNNDDIDNNNNNNNNKNELSCFTKAYFLTGKAKIPGIKEYITYLIDNSCKFLVFAHHIEVLDAIEDEVRHAKIAYVRIDGLTPNEKRHERVTEFQSNSNCLVAILAITACANGLTLTKASTVVFAELHFTPAIMIQAEDRAHRIGQEHQCVNVHYLFASDTVDEIVFNKLKEKHFVVSSTLDNKAVGMNMQDIKQKVGDFEKGFGKSVVREEENNKVLVDKKMNGTLNDFLKIKDNTNYHDKDMKRSQNDKLETIKKKNNNNNNNNNIDDIENLSEEKLAFKSKITKLCMI